jgi:hypothetical protein
MRNSGLGRLITGVILGAYLVTGILSPRGLLLQALHFKLDNSLSFRNERSNDIDERPYWTSHKHLISSEQFSGDHILNTAKPWISVITPTLSLKTQAAFLPTLAYFFPQNALRAPPIL